MQARIDEVLLGGSRRYTRLDVAARAGVPPEQTHRLWRALGFAGATDTDVVFTDADVEAAKLGHELVESGLIDRMTDTAMTRALGHHLSRLAEWQVQVVFSWLGQQPEVTRDERQLEKFIEMAVPMMEQLQNYVWRRHLAAYAGRALAASEEELESRDQGVGFVDMVGYTRMTRRIDQDRLGTVLDRFEEAAGGVIAERRGHVVKMIGDEVLFVADTPEDAADIALALTELVEQDEEIPEVRTGLAYGQILSRFGDVYGAVVNLAARLTSVARPGTILIDQGLADALDDNPDYKLRYRRPVSVRGYKRLRPVVLRRG